MHPVAAPPIGSHLSIAGRMGNAILEADRLGCESLAIFSASPRIWKRTPVSIEHLDHWHDQKKQSRIGPIVMHAAYLANPASTDPRISVLTKDSLCADLLNCQLLGIDRLVLHPGSSPDEDRRSVILRIAKTLDDVFDFTPNNRVEIAIETTAGSRNSIGGQFEDIRDVLDFSRHSDRLSVCFDTAHVFAAGYDLASEIGLSETLDQFDRLIGLNRIHVIHLNDSKSACGSKADRHEHLGLGRIPLPVFRAILSIAAFRDVPMILETPKDAEGKWDRRNLEILRRLRLGRSISEKLLELPSTGSGNSQEQAEDDRKTECGGSALADER